MQEKMHFSFTPSLMEATALEALFVQREDLAIRIVDLTRDSVITPAKYHFLLVGPRGIGKTHLVSLIYHRVRAMADIQENLVVAWLREDGWGIASFLDLLVQILQVLQKEYADDALMRDIETLFEMPPDKAEWAAASILKVYVGDRTLFLIVENLDDLFSGLEDEGQKRLRAFLQENAFCTILATSPSLFSGVSLQTSPFYGFFTVHHLSEFDFDHAVSFLIKIARYKKDKHLTSFLKTVQGRARVRAVHHLAGGNPRVYTIFAQFLNRSSMERLVEPFMRAMDDLTPYYQSRMTLLSAQQRKIMELLCDRGAAVTVKEIAQRCFITHQTASSQLKQLREMRYVKATTIGRESFYELCEPLMRISLEVKKHHGEPLKLFVEFLRCWYTKPELETLLGTLAVDQHLEYQYIRRALSICEESEDPKVVTCNNDFKSYWASEKFDKALAVLDELQAIRGEKIIDLVARGALLFQQGKFLESLEQAQKAVLQDRKNQVAWLISAIAHKALQQPEEALLEVDKALEIEPQAHAVWNLRGVWLQELGRNIEALESFKKVVSINPSNVSGWRGVANSAKDVGRLPEALEAYTRVTELDESDKDARLIQIYCLGAMGKTQEALALSEKYQSILAGDIRFVGIKGMIFSDLGRHTEALSCWDTVIDQGDHSSFVRMRRVTALTALHQWKDVRPALDEALMLSKKESSSDSFSDGAFAQILLAKNDPDVWSQGIELFLELYTKHDLLSILGISLGRTIKLLLSPLTSEAIACMWRDIWKEKASIHKEMSFVLRLMDIALEYRRSKSKRTLMDLPIEERKILEELIEQASAESQ